MTGRYVWQLHEADETRIAEVGGKGAGLGALTRIDGVRVPDGFCVTTDAFRLVARTPALAGPLARLAGADADDPAGLRTAAAEVRRAVERTALPGDVAAAVTAALSGLGADAAYAVRSSATAEDLPTASFAGQQDTYLNVAGTAEVLRHVSRCWASLFTDRAVTYRRRHGIDDRAVDMAVVVQRMVVPDAAGIMFTADPVTGDRTVVSVEAGFGLGETLVSGLVNPDVFTVRAGVVAGRAIGTKARAVHAAPGGGTRETPVDPARQASSALTDAQAVRLAALGRRIEAHFGCPQDIEWALTGDDVHILQSRPITTLFPVPAAAADGRFHVYLSVGHQQMMTDAMKPLGLSMWRLTAMAPMHEAGGRLFVDATPHLSTAAGRAAFLGMIGRADPLTRDALETVLARDVVPAAPDPAPAGPPAGGPPPPIGTDPAIVATLVERSRASLAILRRDVGTRSGPELFDFLTEAFAEHKRVLADPLSAQVIMAGMQATWWLDDKLGEWLGERDAADTLTLSAPGNVTAEMGLALLDVADVIRAHPEVVAFLRDAAADDGFLDELPKLPGGAQARAAVEGYLDRYGMRCLGEIDITRPRWSERPATLVPLILDHVRTFAPGAAARRFAHGRERAQAKAREVLDRLRALPGGEHKAAETQAMIERVRMFAGYREYPKYDIVSRYAVYKQALMAEADRLARAGVLADPEDVFFLTFDEFREAAATGRVDAGLIRRRREEFRAHQALTPPRVLTSDGEALNGSYRRDDVPPGALAGLPVSAGVVEGRARVVTDLAGADLEPGDILVTAHTDPSWTPLFVGAAGLVTEVGGLMTHGAVIAREYGLPAVVAVPDATRLIRDGGRIRVHGTDGYVELLS
ncbi:MULTISPECIES: rifamycin-inactivating phosphotransferase [unclassified Micromonospora]|uniref:rifamycin-inactivating phosphotransferase n=1 Tax=unclassified Micromonospora TaxID=2617518 RepID=UPI001C237A94|nr:MULTISPECIES: rifamycin-inactivating phosphotransferase [unclassified Micromonospora]MBU8861387.1 phosphoenolpyruvate synthase [Micromonospora sp. WMMB482]MDM4780945.1 phosphoenolpyruvate synthase [Micromonospora sp. b486]